MGIFLPSVLCGQTDTLISKLFLNLDITAPRSTICQALRTDKRFIRIITPSDTNTGDFKAIADTYYGKTVDNGVVKEKTDSTTIELTYGFGISKKPYRLGDKFTSSTIIRLELYFSSLDTLTKAYDYILSLLPPMPPPPATSTMSDSELLSSEGSGNGKVICYKHKRQHTELTLYKMHLVNNKYSLTIGYERTDKK